MSRFFQDIELTTWALISTPLFLLAFLTITFIVFHPRNKKTMERVSRFPLEDDNKGAING